MDQNSRIIHMKTVNAEIEIEDCLTLEVMERESAGEGFEQFVIRAEIETALTGAQYNQMTADILDIIDRYAQKGSPVALDMVADESFAGLHGYTPAQEAPEAPSRPLVVAGGPGGPVSQYKSAEARLAARAAFSESLGWDEPEFIQGSAASFLLQEGGIDCD